MLQITTNPDDRKEIARKMNDLFAEASTIKKQAKHRHYMEASLIDKHELNFCHWSAKTDDIEESYLALTRLKNCIFLVIRVKV